MKFIKPFIKICGISRLSDAKLAIDLGADAIGFIAYPNSSRFQNPQQVKEICQQLPLNFPKVLVSVNLPLCEILAYSEGGINTIQLHGDETAEYAKKITLPIWRAIRLQSSTQIVGNFPCEMFIIDSVSKDLQLYGGSGEQANWQLAKEFIVYHKTPTLIAGGIDENNFQQALQATQAYGLDLSSSLEDSPAIKNHQKMQQFFNKINQ